jgi:hypothetical protein
MLRRMSAVAFLLGALALPRPALAVTQVFTYDELTALAQSALGGLEIRINNVGPFLRGSHFRANTSTVKFRGKTLASFNIDPFPIGKVGQRSYAYYVSDLRSETASIAAMSMGFTFTLSFKNAEAHLVPRCTSREGEAAQACSTWPLPDVGLVAAKVVARIEPIAHKGAIAFHMSKVQVLGDPDISYCSGPFADAICKSIIRLPQMAAKIRKKAEERIMSTFNKPEIKDQTAAYMRDNLFKGFFVVTSVKARENDLVVVGKVKLLGATL